MNALAREIFEALAESRLLRVLVIGVLMFALGLVLTAMTMPAYAQAFDGQKPARPVTTVGEFGLFIDPSSPARFCVIEFGVFQPYGAQTFVYCSAGWNNAGSAMVQGGPQLGREITLYRLAGEPLMYPTVVNSVTITQAQQGQITVRFGTPGAQSPPFTLIRQ